MANAFVWDLSNSSSREFVIKLLRGLGTSVTPFKEQLLFQISLYILLFFSSSASIDTIAIGASPMYLLLLLYPQYLVSHQWNKVIWRGAIIHTSLLPYLMGLSTVACDCFLLFFLHLFILVYVTNCLKAFVSLSQFGQWLDILKCGISLTMSM